MDAEGQELWRKSGERDGAAELPLRPLPPKSIRSSLERGMPCLPGVEWLGFSPSSCVAPFRGGSVTPERSDARAGALSRWRVRS